MMMTLLVFRKQLIQLRGCMDRITINNMERIEFAREYYANKLSNL